MALQNIQPFIFAKNCQTPDLMPVTKELLSYLDELGWNYRIEGRENPDRKMRDADFSVEEKETEMVEVDD